MTNVNDEVKGSDGIFLGDYNENKAILFGESKIMKSPMANRKYRNVKNKYKLRTRHVWSLEIEELEFPDIVKLKDKNLK